MYNLVRFVYSDPRVCIDYVNLRGKMFEFLNIWYLANTQYNFSHCVMSQWFHHDDLTAIIFIIRLKVRRKKKKSNYFNIHPHTGILFIGLIYFIYLFILSCTEYILFCHFPPPPSHSLHPFMVRLEKWKQFLEMLFTDVTATARI